MAFQATIACKDGQHLVTIGTGIPQGFRIIDLTWEMDDDDDLFCPIRARRGKMTVAQNPDNPIYEAFTGEKGVGNVIYIVTADEQKVEFVGNIINEQRDMVDPSKEDQFEVTFVSRLGLAEYLDMHHLFTNEYDIYGLHSMAEIIAVTLDTLGITTAYLPSVFTSQFNGQGNIYEIKTSLKSIKTESNDSEGVTTVEGIAPKYWHGKDCKTILENIAEFYGFTWQEYGDYVVGVVPQDTTLLYYQMSIENNGYTLSQSPTRFPTAVLNTGRVLEMTRTEVSAYSKVVVSTKCEKTSTVFSQSEIKAVPMINPATGKQYAGDVNIQKKDGKIARLRRYVYDNNSRDGMFQSIGGIADGQPWGAVLEEYVVKSDDDAINPLNGKVLSVYGLTHRGDTPYKQLCFTNKTPFHALTRSLKMKVSGKAFCVKNGRFTNFDFDQYKMLCIIRVTFGDYLAGGYSREETMFFKTEDEGAAHYCEFDDERTFEVEIPDDWGSNFINTEIFVQYRHLDSDVYDVHFTDLSIEMVPNYTNTFQGEAKYEATNDFKYACYNNDVRNKESYEKKLTFAPVHDSFSKMQPALLWTNGTAVMKVTSGLPLTPVLDFEADLVKRMNRSLSKNRLTKKIKVQLGTLRQSEKDSHAGNIVTAYNYNGSPHELIGYSVDYYNNEETIILQEI